MPTVVVGTYKGGCLKTAIAVALAERLALGGLRVLLLTSDSQHDARYRLGVKAGAATRARVKRGPGTVTVHGMRPSRVVSTLYQAPPAADVAVVDTAPVREAGALPGVLLVAPVDGGDAARNLVSMLRGTPANTDVVLARYHREPCDQWAHNASVIAEAAGTPALRYLADPIPSARPIRAAHDDGRSVWSLPRRGNTKEFLDAVETLAALTWERLRPGKELPPMPPRRGTEAFVPGWSDDEA